MKYIQLTQGKFALVDDEDFENVNHFKWFYEKSGYACRRKSGRSIRMHRFITNAPENMEVDHINGNGLDNRQENLRICTHKENIRNAKVRKDNTSGYKGVYWHRLAKKWQARVFFNGKHISLGYFDTKDKAANAYNQAAKQYFGDFIRL